MRRLQLALCLVVATTARADLSDLKWTDMITLSGRLESDLRFVVDNYRGEQPGEGYTFNINRNDVITHIEIKPIDSVIGVIDARFRFYGFNEANNLPALADRKPEDPRAPRLFQIAAENGFDGPYIKLMKQVAQEAESVYGKPLPINATGAIAAIASELKLPWRIVRGIGVMARAIGLVGHVLEEMREPMAREIKARAEEEATAHRSGGSHPGGTIGVKR